MAAAPQQAGTTSTGEDGIILHATPKHASGAGSAPAAITAAERRRLRESAYPMVPVAEALERILKCSAAEPLNATEVIISDSAALGAVLAEDVVASVSYTARMYERAVVVRSTLTCRAATRVTRSLVKEPVPQFRASIVDGYGVVAADAGRTVRVVGQSLAGGSGAESTASEGVAVYVTTGAPLPAGADAAVKVEDALPTYDEASGVESHVTLPTRVTAGQWIREIGSDIAAGEKVLSKGCVLHAAELGLLATVGCTRVSVWKRPRVGVMSSGDELMEATSEAAESLAVGKIRDSNRLMLLSLLRELGAEPVDCGAWPMRDTIGC